MNRKSIAAILAALMLAAAALPAFGAPARKVELKVFMSFPRFREQFDAYFQKFAAKMLAEKNIEVTVKLEMPASEQANQILKTRIASNDAPDVFTLHAIADIPTFYKAGYLTDLSKASFAGSLISGVKKTVTYDGKLVALPLESLAWGYLYNKKIFADLGIKPPNSIAEMKTAIAKLNAAKVTPFLLSFQESWIPQLMMALSLGGTVSATKPDWVDRMNQGKASYKEVAGVFTIIDLIMQNGSEKPFEVGGAAGCADFAAGKAAMWVQGPWMADTILNANPAFQLGVAPLPVNEDRKATMINLATSTSLAISPTTKNRDVAEALLAFIVDPKESPALFQDLKFNPVAKSHAWKSYPWVDEAMTYVAEGRAYLDLSLPGAVTGEAAKLLQSYYMKSVTKDEIISRLDKAWADSLKAAN